MSTLLDVIGRSTRLGDKTKDAYTKCVEHFLSFAGHDPSQWNGVVVEQWRDHLSCSLKPITVNKYLYALRYASGRIEAMGIGRDFARSAETLHATKERRRAMSLEEVHALMATCADGKPADLRDCAIMTLALRTALRSENVQRICFKDIEDRRLWVVQKGRREHSVILDDQSLDRLGIWTNWLESQGIALRGGVFRRISRQDLKGNYHVGKAIRSPNWFWTMLQKRAKAAGIKRSIHPHLFRHTAITWLLDNGVEPHRVMLQTGQKSMATLSGYVTDLKAEEDPIGNYLPEI